MVPTITDDLLSVSFLSPLVLREEAQFDRIKTERLNGLARGYLPTPQSATNFAKYSFATDGKSLNRFTNPIFGILYVHPIRMY